MKEADGSLVQIPPLDLVKVSVIREEFDQGIGDTLRRTYPERRVRAFGSVVSETVYFASEVLMTPGVSFAIGSGIMPNDGRRYMAMSGVGNEGNPVITYAHEYLKAHLSKPTDERGEGEIEHLLSHPAEVTAHEIKHLKQLDENPLQVMNDSLITRGDNAVWNTTASETDAAGFARAYFEAIGRKLRKEPRRSQNYRMFHYAFRDLFGFNLRLALPDFFTIRMQGRGEG